MRWLRVHGAVLAFLAAMTVGTSLYAADLASLKATVKDVAGKGVEGAKLFIYDSPNVRRPADYISPATDGSGHVQIALPAGEYWVVARLKHDGKYGPLMPGDKHSGAPLEVDISPDGDVTAEFVVADILELGQRKKSDLAAVVRLRGRIVDPQGNPVANAYVYANRTQEGPQVPEYLSAWTDGDGTYEIYLPAKGRYFLGAARQFPPGPDRRVIREFVPSGGKIDVALDITITVH